MDPPDWLDEMATEHYLALGKAVHAWAQIEATLYDYLREYAPSPRIYEWVVSRHRPIPERCATLVAFVESEHEDSDLRSAATKWIRAIEKLGESRNAIAHNPILYWIDDTGEAPTLVQRVVLGKDGSDTGIDLAAVHAFAEKADETRYAFMTAMVRLQPTRGKSA